MPSLTDPAVVAVVDALYEDARARRATAERQLEAADAALTIASRMHDLAHDTALRVVS